MDIWITAQECIGLPNLPTAPFNISNRLKKLATEDMIRRREGSKAYEFHINCLPPVARAAVLKKQGVIQVGTQQIEIKKRQTDSYSRELLWQGWNNANTSQREKARERCEAVIAVAGLLDSGIDTLTAFDSVGEALSMASASVRRWYYQAKPFDRSDWLAALVSQHGHNLSARRKKEAECTPTAWDFFLADYLRFEQPALRTCYARLTEAAAAQGWTIPSLSSLRRKLEREVPAEQVVLLREGEHALMRLYPAQERTVLDLDAMEWINGDGYQHNVFVRWFNGEILRPKTWVWQDIRTRKILGWRTDVSENSDSIRLALADVVEQYGIPRHVTIDNTRAAANKWMTGGVPNRYRFKIKEDDPKGIIPLLGIQLHWTSVLFGRGHGQAKPIERAFSHGGLGEVVDRHPALAGAYTGPNPMAKLDNYGDRVIDAETFLQVLAEGIAFWNRQPKRDTEACQGVLSFDAAFEQSYQESAIRKATAEQRHLLLLPAESVTVNNGTFTLNAGGKIAARKNRYYHEQLLGIKPNKVVIRFDPQSLHESVLCYTLDGRFICAAQCIEKSGFGDTQAAREHERNRTRFVKRTKEATTAQRRMTALEVAELMPETVAPEPPETRVVEIYRSAGNTVRRELVDLHAETENDYDYAFENAVAQLHEHQQKNTI
ncbi:transposase domain-containing protein [Xenorhabdus sp. XENO-7]|uniref:Transposase domain-containing protein n=1 Tax=Xenorhabdus aichiensis TaxID=3025874 RepID=A0ABT5LY26_9GAMM|nr:transposase domain-containing protein [Xenorhabdus aichiensis]MDC9620106.1 transposase domain-containing protein [Xenorhabdus aichiensis]